MKDPRLPQSWSAEQLQLSVDAGPFNAFCGMRVEQADATSRRLVLSIPMRSEFARSADASQFHGGVIAALADTAGCYALVMLLGRGAPTMSLRVDYLRPAVDTGLSATAVVRHLGRSVGLVDVDVTSDTGKLIATARGSFSTVESPGPA